MFTSSNTETPIRDNNVHPPSLAVTDLDMQRFLRRRLLLSSDDIADIDIALAEAAGLIPTLRASRSRERVQSSIGDIGVGDGTEKAG